MAVFTLPGTLLGFRRDRSGAQLVKCTRDDGAPTLLMQPRPGGPPLYEKDIEVHVSATKQYGLAVTVARSDGSFEHTLGDILSDACENVDLATKRRWTWWSGGVVRPEPKGPAVKPRGPGKSASPVVVRKPTPMPKPERSDQPVPVPEVTAQPSSSEASSPSAPEVPREEPAPTSVPTAAADMEAAARVAVVFARQLIPLFVVGFAIAVAAVLGFLRFQHADLMAMLSKQQGAGNNPTFMARSSEPVQAMGKGRLPLYDRQARPPCQGVEQEKDGGCWVEVAAKPPCPEKTLEKDGKCWIPVAAEERKREPRSGEAR